MPERILLCDWGGTLMVTMPSYSTREGKWSLVDAVPHAEETLNALAGSWTLGLASNASESGEEAILQSLATIGLGKAFSHIYTYRRIGRPKPLPEFWAYILRDLAVAPEQIVMIGDDYMADIWGATQAGMYGVWLNVRTDERKQNARTATIAGWQELPGALEQLGV